MDNSFIITDIHRIIYISESEYPERIIDFSHSNISNELIFHLSGSSAVLFNDEALRCIEGTVRFLPAGKVKKYKVIRDHVPEQDTSLKLGCIDICFSSDRPVSDKAFVLNFAENKALQSLFKTAFSLWTAKNDGYYHECMSLIYAIFAEIEKEKSYISNKKYAHIEKIIEYMNAHFTEETITVEKICSLSSVSYSYIKKLFKSKFGVSPEKYVMQLKLNYACELLHTNHTVSQTAEMAGFCDVSYFSKQFKKAFGITPTEHKRKCVSSK